jgi:hypothetical protein
MKLLLPAHCGHKKASGNHEYKDAASDNWVCIRSLRSPSVAPMARTVGRDREPQPPVALACQAAPWVSRTPGSRGKWHATSWPPAVSGCSSGSASAQMS